MNKEDFKIGDKVSFYFSGSKTKEREMFFRGKARTVNGVVYRIHRVNIEILETKENGGIISFYKKPSELIKIDKKEKKMEYKNLSTMELQSSTSPV